MAIKHIDLYNGNDANDGSTWALAKKTIPPGTDGDDYKISKTPAGIQQPYSGTWDEAATFIELDSAQTLLVHNSDSAWTRVTPYSAVSTTNRKISTASHGIYLSLASNYPLGKTGFLPLLSTVDGSAFQKMGVWIYTPQLYTSYAIVLKICLCSDANGDVIVHSWNLPINSRAGSWEYFVFDNGSPLSSNINSIALYVESKTSSSQTCSFYFNNFNLCGDLHCNKLIGNQSGYLGYRAIKSIVGTKVYIEDTLLTNNDSTMQYSGESVYAPVYLLEPIIDKNTNTSDGVYSKEFVTGGYNPITDEVDGITFFDGMNSLQNGLFRAGSYKGCYNLGFSRFLSGIRTYSEPVIENCIFVSSKNAFNLFGGNPSYPVINNCFAYGVDESIFPSTGNIVGLRITNLYAENCGTVVRGTSTSALTVLVDIVLINVTAKNSALITAIKINGGYFENCYTSGLNKRSYIFSGNQVLILNSIFDTTFNSSQYYHFFDCLTESIISNCSFAGNVRGFGTHFYNCIFPTYFSARSYIQATNCNQIEGYNIRGSFSGSSAPIKEQLWQTAIKKNAEDAGAWMFVFYQYGNIKTWHIHRKLFEFAYVPNSVITIKFWTVSYSVNSNQAGTKINAPSVYKILKDIPNGILNDIVVESIAIADWNLITLNFSATRAGIYTLYLCPPENFSYGGTVGIFISPIEIT